MSFGLRTWGAGGDLELDTNSFTYQVMYNQTHTLSNTPTITITINGFTTDKCVAVILPFGDVTSEDASQAMPYIYQENGRVVIYDRPKTATDLSGSSISFRLLAMRFRN